MLLDATFVRSISLRHLWVLTSLVVSLNIGFRIFPTMYKDFVSVPAYFLAVEGPKITYWKFNAENIKNYSKFIPSPFRIYYNTCDIISSQKECDITKNWRSVSLDYHCGDKKGCLLDKIALTRELRNLSLAEVIGTDGNSRNLREPLSNQDPKSLLFWGEDASWPIAILCLFFLLKLGGTLFDFLNLKH